MRQMRGGHRAQSILTSRSGCHPGAAAQLRAMKLTRRHLIAATATAGAGLVLGYYALRSRRSRDPLAQPEALDGAPGELRLSALLRIAPDGRVHIASKQAEIGQGVKTSLPMAVAEELDAAWSQVVVEQADFDPGAFGNQYTGGSESTPAHLMPMRRLGATARAMLVGAAAKRWSVSAAECSTAAGQVRHAASGRVLGYGVLAGDAAAQPVPDARRVPLKDPARHTLLGRRVPGIDIPAIVTGVPLYASDLHLPGLLHAMVEREPVPGARVGGANLQTVQALPGVRAAFVLAKTGDAYGVRAGVAVVADSTWHALQARRHLTVTWDESAAVRQGWDDWVQAAEAARGQPPADVLRQDGDAPQALHAAQRVVQAAYRNPFIAHAAMEPLNATAWWHDGRMEIWSLAQNPWQAREQVAQALDVLPSKITLHQLRCGGAFGRRLSSDHILEAAALAQRVQAPVRVTWTREDDLRHDHFRGGGFHFLRAGLDAEGRVSAWHDRFVTFGKPGAKLRPGMGFGPDVFPAGWMPHCLVERSVLPCDIATGYWRSPGSNTSTWVMQSFVDELAHAAGADPLAFRLQWLNRAPAKPGFDVARTKRVLQAAAERAGWGRALPRGQGEGLAFFAGNGACAAHVVEVSVTPQGRLAVDRVVCVVDVGDTLVNASAAEAQVQGSIMDGLAAAWVQKVDIRNGRAVTANFDAYRMLRMADAPREINVHFLRSDAPASGLGEPALPGTAPALCNAIFRATGVRVRQLPISELSLAWT